METQSDQVLLAAFAGGDPGAARVLTARLAPRVYAQAVRSLQDRAEAEDVTQEAMMRLWRIAPTWRAGEAKVTTWLWQVTANLCTDRLRKRGRITPLDAAKQVEDGAPSASDRIQQASRAAALDAALLDLPERQRIAVRLRHIEGLGNEEIAARMHASIEAVESLTARGCRALKRSLADQRTGLGFTDDD